MLQRQVNAYSKPQLLFFNFTKYPKAAYTVYIQSAGGNVVHSRLTKSSNKSTYYMKASMSSSEKIDNLGVSSFVPQRKNGNRQ